MAKRDPNKTARNKRVKLIVEERRLLQEQVFNEIEQNGYDYCNEASLNAFIGSKIDDYIDLIHDEFRTPMDFTSAWLKGLKECALESMETGNNQRHVRMYNLLKGDNPYFKKYVGLFLEGAFLKHYDELYKKRPKIDESEYWFGNNNDEFGLLVTPRWRVESWENDKSEIRHFKYPYWTISHVLETGLCYLNENKIKSFSNLNELLSFFRDMVRRTGSKFQLQIADLYTDFVKGHGTPVSIPFLIPELRYDPLKRKHEYRLDFTIINPWTMNKVGFEISPWSTHGKLEGKKKLLSELNKEARENFEGEMQKHKKYWRKYGINYIIYTDKDLENIDEVWEEIKSYLEPQQEGEQLELHLINELLV